MAPLKQKGDLAELKVAADLGERGYGIAWPHGEDCDFDLIAYRGDELHRVQVKHSGSGPDLVSVKCTSHSLTNGQVRRTKHYTAATIDWLAVFHRASERCFYIPAAELGQGRSQFHLRLVPTRNNQRARINYASNYRYFGPDPPSSAPVRGVISG